MSSTAVSTPSTGAEPVAGWRLIIDVVQKWVALLGLLLSLLQVAFAALGFWGAEEKPGDQAWGMAAFLPHATNGMILYIVAAVLFAIALVLHLDVDLRRSAAGDRRGVRRAALLAAVHGRARPAARLAPHPRRVARRPRRSRIPSCRCCGCR